MGIDIRGRSRIKAAMLAIAAAFLLLLLRPAAAMVGGADLADANLGRQIVMIVGSNGAFCSAAVLAPRLLLTAAHCFASSADYKLVEYDAARKPLLKDIATIARHPQFSQATLAGHRAAADVALIKLAAPLAAAHRAVTLGAPREKVKPGDAFVVAGYGITREADARSGGTLREARLVATGRPGNLQIRLVDPQTNGERAGRGACTGDSGAPVFQESDAGPVVIGVVSWTTGPGMTAGCGGLTGVTPLELYRGWIAQTAKRMGSALP
jgi:secreted trypsin-like serine protease